MPFLSEPWGDGLCPDSGALRETGTKAPMCLFWKELQLRSFVEGLGGGHYCMLQADS